MWPLLDRYLSGECTASEIADVEAWASRPGNDRTLKLVRRIWSEAGAPREVIDVERDLLKLQARIATARKAPALRMVQPSAPRFSRRYAFAAVAAAAAVIAVAVPVWRSGVIRRVASMSPLAGVEYTTARGERTERMLDDGTRVWLNVDSRLQVAAGYGVQRREVTLEGEAFFVVRHDASRPFRVHTRHASTQVLGTEFGVRSYPGDEASVVVVSSGRVSLGATTDQKAADAAVALTAGQEGRRNAQGKVTISSVNVEEALGWRAGRLAFAGEPLRRVVAELERWYDLEIDLADSSLADIPVTASFTNASPDQALAIIVGTLDVGCSRRGRVVRLDSESPRDAAACTSTAGRHTPATVSPIR